MKNGTGPMAKIQFPSANAEGQGVMELARRVRVIIVGEGDTNFCFAPTKSLAALKAQDIIDVEDTPENRTWFVRGKAKLKRRFRQEEI